MPLDDDPTSFWGGPSVDVPSAPDNAGSLVPIAQGSSESFLDVLKSVGSGVTDVAKTVFELQIARDNLAANQQQRQFNQYKATAELDLARSQLDGNVAIAKLGVQAQLAKAQAALKDPQSLTMILAIVGVGLVVLQMMQKK